MPSISVPTIPAAIGMAPAPGPPEAVASASDAAVGGVGVDAAVGGVDVGLGVAPHWLSLHTPIWSP